MRYNNSFLISSLIFQTISNRNLFPIDVESIEILDKIMNKRLCTIAVILTTLIATFIVGGSLLIIKGDDWISTLVNKVITATQITFRETQSLSLFNLNIDV